MSAWQQILSVLIGLAVILISTLGKRVVVLIDHWLESKDPLRGQKAEPGD